jgi:hypothetical protein
MVTFSTNDTGSSQLASQATGAEERPQLTSDRRTERFQCVSKRARHTCGCRFVVSANCPIRRSSSALSFSIFCAVLNIAATRANILGSIRRTAAGCCDRLLRRFAGLTPREASTRASPHE